MLARAYQKAPLRALHQRFWRTSASLASAASLSEPEHLAAVRKNLAAGSSGEHVIGTQEGVHAEVPIIDFAPFWSDDLDARARLSAQLFEAMKDIGFVTLINHGIPAELHEAAYEESKRFFALPTEKKQEFAVTAAEMLGMGYVGVQQEMLDSQVPDLKENFSIVGPMLDAGDDNAAVSGLWPRGLPQFRSTMLALYRRNDALRADVLSCLAMAMGLGERYFEPFFEQDRPTNVLRLLRYPPCERSALSADGQKRAGVRLPAIEVRTLSMRCCAAKVPGPISR